jgi:cytochrome P450
LVEYFSGMISTDNPKHARLRRIVSNAFNPRNIRAVEDSIERVTNETLTRAINSGTGDFIPDIAAPFVLEIICSMMGVPPSEFATVLRCSNVILSQGDTEYIPEGTDPLLAVLEAGATLTRIMEEIGKYRLDNPIDDITSALVRAEIESEKLTHQELASFFVLLVTAGNETTRTALGHALHVLSEHPDQKARLSADYEGLCASATDEIVRWAGAVGVEFRERDQTPPLQLLRSVLTTNARRPLHQSSGALAVPRQYRAPRSSQAPLQSPQPPVDGSHPAGRLLGCGRRCSRRTRA